MFPCVQRIDLLAVNYVQDNPLAEILWKRFGFQPVLMTAIAERREIETVLGVGSRRIVPVEVPPAPEDRRAYVSGSLSG